jgi:hypothetical protein
MIRHEGVGEEVKAAGFGDIFQEAETPTAESHIYKNTRSLIGDNY